MDNPEGQFIQDNSENVKLWSKITTEVKKIGRPPSNIPQISYCEICQKDFSTSKSLKLHMMSNKHKNKENPKSTFCETCEKEYTTPNKLKMHLMTNKHILLVQEKSIGHYGLVQKLSPTFLSSETNACLIQFIAFSRYFGSI